jgi:hypothetical protein
MKRLMIGAILAMLAAGTTWIGGQEPSRGTRTRRTDSGSSTSDATATNRIGRPSVASSPTGATQAVAPAIAGPSAGSLLTETYTGDGQGRTVVGQLYKTESLLSEEQIDELQELRQVVEELRSGEGKTDEQMTELRRQAKEILGKQIDRDVQQRQKKLVEIERRAVELRKQLEARQQNKEKTIEMLLMLAENPGAGLGIPNEWLQSLMQNQGTFRYTLPASGYGEAIRANVLDGPSFSSGLSTGETTTIEATRAAGH